MRATTPLDELEYKGDIVQLPQPMYPIGTKIDVSRLPADDYAYYARNVFRQALRRDQDIIYSLKAEGYMEDMVGKNWTPCDTLILSKLPGLAQRACTR